MNHFERARVNPTYSPRGFGDHPVDIPTPSPAQPLSESASHTSELAIVERLLDGSTLGRTLAASLLIALTISPLLKGIVAGLAIIGAAGAVRTLLGT